MSSQSTDVSVKLTYLQWQSIYNDTRPYRIAQFGRKKKNAQKLAHNLIFHKGDSEELIRDIRKTKEQGAQFSLEMNGFIYREYPSSSMAPSDFWSAEQVEKVFLPECEAVIRNEIKGVDQVYIFDWKLRKKKTAKDRQAKNRKLLSRARQVHVDTLLTVDPPQTPTMERIRNHLPEQARHLLSGRVQMINIWRPINGPVEESPIAVCDGRSVDTSRLIGVDITRGRYTGTVQYALYDSTKPFHWYYMSRQSDEDVLLFKSFDSRDGSVKHVPHTSFPLPEARNGVRARESIEVRALGFVYPTI
ncbi:hypothetical protein V6000_004464 [Aspergillus fumigatus]